jgi:hypothetical protein
VDIADSERADEYGADHILFRLPVSLVFKLPRYSIDSAFS